MHGLKNKLILNGVLFYLIELGQFAFYTFPRKLLNEDHNKQHKEHDAADNPQHRYEIIVLSLSIEQQTQHRFLISKGKSKYFIWKNGKNDANFNKNVVFLLD